ncbi:sucrase ferredoxin [Brucella sp. BE17]|uniref:sucrase ferredoxin n=1 Tax=Brucella sp. BE17 TaxID=3142977 RepID=UPI0031BA076A
MPEELSEAIMTANQAGIHVALVEGDEIALSCETVMLRTATTEILTDQLLMLAAGEKLCGERDERITILCCTDGKQDPCCARYGFATWKALHDHADPEAFRVLQSTHIGGCRFAASLLVLPQRARYGRLEPQDVPDFLSCLNKGIPFLPAYRGNPELDAIEQVAEYAALSFWNNIGVQEKITLGQKSDEVSERDVEIIASTESQRLLIRLRLDHFDVNTRCNTLKPDGQTDQVGRWSAVSVTPLT